MAVLLQNVAGGLLQRAFDHQIEAYNRIGFCRLKIFISSSGGLQIRHNEGNIRRNGNFPFTRKEAGFPMKSDVQDKYFPHVTRIDDAYGDRNLVCKFSAE